MDNRPIVKPGDLVWCFDGMVTYDNPVAVRIVPAMVLRFDHNQEKQHLNIELLIGDQIKERGAEYCFYCKEDAINWNENGVGRGIRYQAR